MEKFKQNELNKQHMISIVGARTVTEITQEIEGRCIYMKIVDHNDGTWKRVKIKEITC